MTAPQSISTESETLPERLDRTAVYLAALGRASGDTRWEAAELMREAAKALRDVAQAELMPASLQARFEVIKEGLTLGRDAVMESFDYVSDKTDQMNADMRLRSIDAAISALPSTNSGDAA